VGSAERNLGADGAFGRTEATRMVRERFRKIGVRRMVKGGASDGK
jgi:hypothetical protein